MKNRAGDPRARTILGAISLVFLCIVLYAGLRPFHAPSNLVTWIPGMNGLRFGGSSTILSSGSFPSSSGESRSLEIWIRPGRIRDSNTMLTFYDPEEPVGFGLHQSVRDLELRLESSAAWHSAPIFRMYFDNAFRDGATHLWAVTTGPSGTALYRDGVKVKESAAFVVSSHAFSGRLVIGTSPIFNSDWSGILRGLAVYNRALTDDQIARHYTAWTSNGRPEISAADDCAALYLFDEHAGSVVRNAENVSALDLQIPAKYMLVNQTVIDPVWRAFRWSRGFWQDALINVGGFIPVGFIFSAYFQAHAFRRPALTASILGSAISVFIELTQVFLPTRDSSMSDLITNIAGSIIGAFLYYGSLGRIADACIDWILQRAPGSVRQHAPPSV